MSVRHGNYWHILPIACLLMAYPAASTEEAKTVLGPSNVYLYDGANALMAGDGAEGVRLTQKGLQVAHGAREERIGHSNLCAGFLMIDQPETALVHCNWVLERDARHWRTYNNRALVYMRLERYEDAEEDIRKGQELRPNSKNLKIVKGMYLDETQPVKPRVEADDRRTVPKDPGDKAAGDVVDQ
jgi:tetratricopeptide (TPR) repeat protein